MTNNTESLALLWISIIAGSAALVCLICALIKHRHAAVFRRNDRKLTLIGLREMLKDLGRDGPENPATYFRSILEVVKKHDYNDDELGIPLYKLLEQVIVAQRRAIINIRERLAGMRKQLLAVPESLTLVEWLTRTCPMMFDINRLYGKLSKASRDLELMNECLARSGGRDPETVRQILVVAHSL